MSYQSEAALEQQFTEQLNKQGYNPVSIPDYDALLENFKIQFAAFNAAKLDHPLTDKEWERVFNIMLGKSVFQSAKILRDKFVLEMCIRDRYLTRASIEETAKMAVY